MESVTIAIVMGGYILLSATERVELKKSGGRGKGSHPSLDY
jgi:hypothetical protein